MAGISMKPDGYYSRDWCEYRKRRRIFLCAIFLMPFPWFMLTHMFFYEPLQTQFNITLDRKWFFLYVQFLPWILAVVFFRFRFAWWRCPGCQRPFHSFPFSDACPHCGLIKWTLPQEKAREGNRDNANLFSEENIEASQAITVERKRGRGSFDEQSGFQTWPPP
jgi:hypothetical protein